MPQRNGSLKQLVYTSILEDLIRGVYKQGDILNEKQLVEKYSVSKSPVRDALVALCNENVLRSLPRYGYEIVTITEGEVDDIIAFRGIVEPACLRRGFSEIRENGGLQALYRMIARHDTQRQEDIFRCWGNNMEFHLTLCAYSGNAYCRATLEKSMNILTRAYAQYYWDRWRRTDSTPEQGSHIEIMDAIGDGDCELAARLLEEDIGSFGKDMFI